MITNPTVTDILKQCNEQGLTAVTHMNETLSCFAGIMASLLEAASPLEFGYESDPEVMSSKLTIAARLLETLFGAPAGSFHLVKPV